MLTRLNQLRQLNYNGKILYYVVKGNSVSKWTEFWILKPSTHFIKRWILFGPADEYVRDVCDFTLPFDICNNIYTKFRIRTAIDDEFALLFRQREIENGEII